MSSLAKVVSFCRLSYSVGVRFGTNGWKKGRSGCKAQRLCLWACFVLFIFAESLPALEKLPGDINGDRRVDFGDFFILAQNFGKTGGRTFNPNANTDTVRVTVRDTIKIIPL